jgi:hypothetical protein
MPWSTVIDRRPCAVGKPVEVADREAAELTRVDEPPRLEEYR